MENRFVNRHGAHSISGCSLAALVALVFVSQAHAYGLYKSARTELNAGLNAVFGDFHSQESYAQVRTSSGSQSWQEGFVKYGLSGSYALTSSLLSPQ